MSLFLPSLSLEGGNDRRKGKRRVSQRSLDLSISVFGLSDPLVFALVFVPRCIVLYNGRFLVLICTTLLSSTELIGLSSALGLEKCRNSLSILKSNLLPKEQRPVALALTNTDKQKVEK